MKRRNMLAVLLAFLISFVCILPVSANSAPREWKQADIGGALPRERACPITVQHETLTIRVPSLSPKEAPAGNTVTAEYTFCNPTDQDVRVLLDFPIGVDGGAGIPDGCGILADGREVPAAQ